jgi:Flp pilus assembly protein TadD
MRRLRATRVLFGVVWLIALVPLAFAARPWDEPFAERTADIAKAAASVSASDADVILLLEDHQFVIQKDGKMVSRYRRIYRIMTASAVDDWASVEQEWQPWHEGRPELRARVISPDGKEHWLDPKTIADAPVAQFDNTIFSDAKLLRAPLPAAAEGAVVEYEIVKRDTAPMFAAGVSRELLLDAALPIERFHISIDASKGVDLRTASSLIPVAAITRTESKLGTHVEVELGRREAEKDIEFSVSSDQPQYPSFRFSTGVSWQTVAAAYERIVSQQTSMDDAKSLLRELGLNNAPSFPNLQQAAESLTAQLHKSVRYTGVEFGQAAIIPNPPHEVINRHYGDCKDKATLLMTMLRSVGFDAHVALLRVGTFGEVDPELPGFGLFDHAIVFVGGKQPLWIDATADSARVGTLPIGDQGRLALIVDGSTTTLTKTPVSSAADNRIVYNIEIHLTDNGKGNVRESLEATGSFELQMRSTFGGNEHEIRAAMERRAKNSFNAESVGEFKVTTKDDFSQPFRLFEEVKNSGAAVTALQDAAVRLSNGFLFEDLPFVLAPRRTTVDGEQKPRKHDFVVQMPYHSEVHFKIYPPADFNANQLPTPQHFEMPGASYTSESKRDKDGTIHVDYQFELSSPRLTPAEFETLRSELKKAANDDGRLLAFAYRGANLLAVGKTNEALQMAQKSVRKDPNNSLAQMRFSQLLMESGASKAALLAAQQAVEHDANSARAWLTLAFAYEHDSFGRLRNGDWNPGEAEKALRKAMKLDAKDIEAASELAILLEYDKTGERYTKAARMAESISIYQQILKKAPNPAISQNLAITLMHMGRYREAQEELQKASQQPAYPTLTIVLIALIDGPENAIISNQNLFPDTSTRTQNLAQAGLILNQLRNYAAGTELWRAAQRLSNNPQLEQMLRFYGAAKPYETKLGPSDDPKALVQQFLILAAKSASAPDELASLLSKHAELAAWKTRLDRARNNLGVVRANLMSIGGTTDMFADLVISGCKIEISDESKPDEPVGTPPPRVGPASKSGVAVQVVKPSITGQGPSKPATLVTVTSPLNLGLLRFFVVRENGKAKLLATGDGLESIGRLALDALANGDLASAQAWLDEVKDSALPESARDDKGPAIRYLWAGVAPETRNPIFAKAAAASLLGTYGGSAEAVTILRQISLHPAQYMEQEDLNFAICEALDKARNWKELLEPAQRLLKSRAYQEAGMRFLGEAFSGLEDWPGLAKATESRLAVSPKDHIALQFATIAAMAQGDHDKSAKYVARLKNAPYMAYLDDDLLAGWDAILAGKVPDEVVTGLNNGNGFSTLTKGSAYAYTLALAQLRNGKAEECRRTLAIALQGEGANPSGLAWLVEGELLKQYSLDSEAASAFERARSAGGFEQFGFAKILLRQ